MNETIRLLTDEMMGHASIDNARPFLSQANNLDHNVLPSFNGY